MIDVTQGPFRSGAKGEGRGSEGINPSRWGSALRAGQVRHADVNVKRQLKER